MSKKSLDRKTAKHLIIEGRDNGKTDQEIYYELTELYFDKKAIALLITGTANKPDIEKYKIYNNILLLLIGLTILIKVLNVLNLSLEGQVWVLLFIFIVPLLNIYFFYEIARYNAHIYRFCGILTIASFLQTVSKEASFLVSFVLSASIVGLAFFLDAKLFPNYSPNNLKKDNNGEFIL